MIKIENKMDTMHLMLLVIKFEVDGKNAESTKSDCMLNYFLGELWFELHVLDAVIRLTAI